MMNWRLYILITALAIASLNYLLTTEAADPTEEYMRTLTTVTGGSAHLH